MNKVLITPAAGSIVPKGGLSHSNQCSRTFQVINKRTGDNYAFICMVPSIVAEIVLSGFEICCLDYWTEECLSLKSCILYYVYVIFKSKHVYTIANPFQSFLNQQTPESQYD